MTFIYAKRLNVLNDSPPDFVLAEALKLNQGSASLKHRNSDLTGINFGKLI